MRLAAETSSGFMNGERGDSARDSKSEKSALSSDAEDVEGVDESKDDKVEGPPRPNSGSGSLAEDDGESGGVLSHSGILYGSTRLGPNLKAESSLKPGHTQL